MVPESFEIEVEIRVSAPRERVFTALTTGVGRWWHLRIRQHDLSTTMVLEPHVGGRFFEDLGDGTGALWGTVLDFLPPKLLRIGGPLSMRTPVTCVFEYHLEEDGNDTIVKFQHRCFGWFEASMKEKHVAGWRQLFDALKAYAEHSR